MEHPFDSLARSLAGQRSRRSFLRVLAAGLGAGVVARVRPGAAVAAPCRNDSDCPDNETCCNGACTTLLQDPTNCGTCGNVCAGGQHCDFGNCCNQCETGIFG